MYAHSVRPFCEHVFVVDSAEDRHCKHCDMRKAISEFAWRNRAKGRRAPFCRSCQAEYMRAHYLANKELYVARAEASKRRARLERTKLLLKYFETHPCTDCGETDALVLEFDHLRDKCFDIGTAFACRRWATVLAEIEKCEVVCANCHRRRTVTRCGGLRARLVAEAGDETRTRSFSLEG